MVTPVMNKKQRLAVSVEPTATTESELVLAALDGRAPSSEDTLDWFNENIPDQYKTKNRQSIHNWTIGENSPSHLYLNALVIFYAEGDPRRVMAEQILEMRRTAIRAHWVGASTARGKSPRSAQHEGDAK